MRYFLFLWGVVLCATCSASAQSSPTNPLLLSSPFSMSFGGPASVTSTTPSTSTVSVAPGAATPAASPFSSAPSLNLSPDPQQVQGVFVNYSWQAYFGYTYFHFNGPHGISRSQNGFNYSIVYYIKPWFGLDGEMMATHDSPNGQSSWFLFGGGGPRFRWQLPKGIELWAHGLVGYSHLTPQTPFGSQSSFAYAVGGGADFSTPFRRFNLRVGADMVGTLYFNGNQYNPKVFAGLVFKF